MSDGLVGVGASCRAEHDPQIKHFAQHNLWPMGVYYSGDAGDSQSPPTRIHLYATVLPSPAWEILPRDGLTFAGMPLFEELTRLHRPHGSFGGDPHALSLTTASRLAADCLEPLGAGFGLGPGFGGAHAEGWAKKMSFVCSQCGCSTDGHAGCLTCGGASDNVDGSWHYSYEHADERRGHRL